MTCRRDAVRSKLPLSTLSIAFTQARMSGLLRVRHLPDARLLHVSVLGECLPPPEPDCALRVLSLGFHFCLEQNHRLTNAVKPMPEYRNYSTGINRFGRISRLPMDEGAGYSAETR